MSNNRALFDRLISHFDASAAADMDETFQYHLGDGESYYLRIADGQCTLHEGELEEPSVTLKLDPATMLEILDGETDGMQAFMAGRVVAEGNIMLAPRLAELFPVE